MESDPKMEKRMDVTLMCKSEVPAQPVTIYGTGAHFTCPHCQAQVQVDLQQMKLDHEKHELRQIVEKGMITSS